MSEYIEDNGPVFYNGSGKRNYKGKARFTGLKAVLVVCTCGESATFLIGRNSPRYMEYLGPDSTDFVIDKEGNWQHTICRKKKLLH